MRLRHVLLLLLVVYAAHAAAPAAAETGGKHETQSSGCPGESTERPQDSLWLVSTRHLGSPSQYNPDKLNFQVMRYDWSEGWQDSDLEAFFSGNKSGKDRFDVDKDGGCAETISFTAPGKGLGEGQESCEVVSAQPLKPDIVTAIYVHGNRVGRSRSSQRGMLAYRSLVRGVEDPQPIRFVIWSWPSTKICGPLRDVRSKAARSDRDSYYLGMFLSRLDPRERVGMYGFSYGSRVISGALHLVGGGELLGLTVPCNIQRKEERKTRAVLMGAAMHNYWLLPKHRHGNAVPLVDRMLVQYNPCDRVLRMYRFLARRSRPRALGYTAFPWVSELGEDASRIEQQNVASQIGNNHDMRAYFASPKVMSKLRQCVLWQE